MRSKIGRLTEALQGRFSEHHRFMVGFRLRRIDRVTGDIAEVDARIDELIEANALVVARDLVAGMHGMGKHTAEDLLAEIGADMSVFPTSQALASWVGVAPGSHESAGVRRPVKVRAGNRYAKRALGIAAKAASRMRHSFLGARFRRVCARRGYMKALVALQRTMITAVWHMLSTGQPYHDLGADYYTRRSPGRGLHRQIRALREAGYQIQPPATTA